MQRTGLDEPEKASGGFRVDSETGAGQHHDVGVVAAKSGSVAVKESLRPKAQTNAPDTVT